MSDVNLWPPNPKSSLTSPTAWAWTTETPPPEPWGIWLCRVSVHQTRNPSINPKPAANIVDPRAHQKCEVQHEAKLTGKPFAAGLLPNFKTTTSTCKPLFPCPLLLLLRITNRVTIHWSYFNVKNLLCCTESSSIDSVVIVNLWGWQLFGSPQQSITAWLDGIRHHLRNEGFRSRRKSFTGLLIIKTSSQNFFLSCAKGSPSIENITISQRPV